MTPRKGIDGVRMGDSLRTVKRKLGAPSETFTQPGITRLEYEGRKLTVTVNKGRGVTYLVTTNHRERTAKGVGPGSTFAAVEAAYPGSCSPDYPTCTVSTPTIFTQFQSPNLSDKRVQVVQIRSRLGS